MQVTAGPDPSGGNAGRDMTAPAPHEAGAPAAPPEVAVVIAVLDEAENVEAVTAEVVAALEPFAPFELVYVDDGSR
ncbi:MAG: hypothetical protein WA840_07915, partial [Caulobacteraceae bacterium]